jgi:HK97 family phage portal protein
MGALSRLRDFFIVEQRSLGTAYSATYPNVYVDAAGRMSTHFVDVNAGVIVDERSTMSIPGVWRGVTLISDAIGQLPLHAYRKNGQYVNPQPLLLERPVPTETRMETLSAMVSALLVHGNYIAILGAPGANGYPDQFYPVNPARVSVIRRDGEIYYKIYDHEHNPVEYRSDEILHIKGFSQPGDLVGYGILAAQRQSLGGAIAVQTYAQRYFNGGAVPNVVIESTDPDLSQEKAEQLKFQWMQHYGGINHAPPVLNETTKIKEISHNARDSQLIEARTFSLTEIANILGLPGYYLGAPNSSRTYSNVSEENLQLVRWSLMPWIARIEQKLTDYLPRGQYVKFNLDALLRPDTKSRYEAHKIALESGFLTVDEVREIEDLDPMEPITDLEDDVKGTEELDEELDDMDEEMDIETDVDSSEDTEEIV